MDDKLLTMVQIEQARTRLLKIQAEDEEIQILRQAYVIASKSLMDRRQILWDRAKKETVSNAKQ